MLEGLDVHDGLLGLPGGVDGAHFQHVRVLLQQLVGHVGNGGLGGRSLTGVLQAQSQHHLALPQGDGVHQRGLDLLQHEGVVILQKPGLGAHLHGDHAGELQVVDLLLKAVAQVGKVVVGLGVLLAAGGGGLLLELLQVVGTQIVQALFARNDIHGELFVVLGVQLIHLVQHGDVLHQHHLMRLQRPDDLVHVDLGLGIAGLQGLQVLALLLEETEDTLLLLFLLAKALQLHHQVGQSLAHLAKVLGFHAVQGVFREGGDVLLGGGAVLEHQVGVGDVNLLGKLVHHLFLGIAEHGLVQLDGVGVPLGLEGGGVRLGSLGCSGLQGELGGRLGGGGLQGQFRSGSGLSGGAGGI